MHFPVETPQEILNFGRSLGLTEEDITGPRGLQLPPPVQVRNAHADVMASGLLGMAGNTLTAMHSTLPATLVNALINIPEGPSLQDWHRFLERQEEAADTPSQDQPTEPSRARNRRSQASAGQARRRMRRSGLSSGVVAR